MSDGAGGTGPVMVRGALEAMRFATAQVYGSVAHVPDDAPASASTVLVPGPDLDALRHAGPPITSVECLRTSAPGVALEVVTYLRTDYGPRARTVRMRRRDGDRWRASFEVRRVPEPRDDAPATFEYLVEVPHHDAVPADRPTVGLAALSVIDFVTRHGFGVAFVHAPASPPAPLGVPCRPHGPCARVGVAVPRHRTHEVPRLVAELVERVSALGFHLWARDTETPDAAYDAWRALYPGSLGLGRRPAPPGPPPAAGGPGLERVAITCIGPARRGVMRELAGHFAAANAQVRAVTAVKLDELTIAHGVVDAESIPRLRAPSGDGPLHELLGVPDAEGLTGFRAFWSALGRPPAMPHDHGVLWMTWRVRTPHQLSPDVVASAWAAVGDACDRWAPRSPFARPRVDYVISRARPGDLLQGRAKVVLDLDAVRFHWPEGIENGNWLRRFCAEVEDRWRAQLEASLAPRRADLVVGWSESWLASRPTARR